MRSSRGRWLVIFIGNLCLVLGLATNDLKHHQSIVQLSTSVKCCNRHEKYEHIQNGMPGVIDVGHCRRSCRRDPLQDRSQEINPEECPPDNLCRPASSQLRRVSTFGGIQEVAVVERCECQQKPAQCTRMSHTMRVFPDTPYETRLDVGSCAGHCHTGGCQAVQSRSVSVAGPNGAQCYSVIEECSCSESCYRARHIELVYDYNNVTAYTEHDDEQETERTQPMLKEVDIGQCVGSCSRQDDRHCATPFWRNNEPCTTWLTTTMERRCAPSSYNIQNYTARAGELSELIVITGCKCQ